MRKVLYLLMSSLLCIGCNPKQSDSPENEEEFECSSPHATVYIQPYEDFTRKEAEKLLPVLEEQFGKWAYGGWTFKVLDPAALPKDSYVPKKNRYRGTEILNQEKEMLKNNKEVVIGVTHKDICANVHDVEDYGIVGLSFMGQNVSIVSDKRLKHKSDLWKPMQHEFMHAFYNSPHCPNDDPACILKDAKGHGNFHIQNKLCDSCRKD